MSCIPLPLPLHQAFQYHQIPSHHCNFKQELVGCRMEASGGGCVCVCPFTDLCLTAIQDLEQNLTAGQKEVLSWTSAPQDGMGSSTLFHSFLKVLIEHLPQCSSAPCLRRELGGFYCRGGLKPFPMLEERVCRVQADHGQVMQGHSMKLIQEMPHYLQHRQTQCLQYLTLSLPFSPVCLPKTYSDFSPPQQGFILFSADRLAHRSQPGPVTPNFLILPVTLEW